MMQGNVGEFNVVQPPLGVVGNSIAHLPPLFRFNLENFGFYSAREATTEKRYRHLLTLPKLLRQILSSVTF